MRWSSVFLLFLAATLGATGSLLGQIRLGDQLGGPSRSPLAGLEGDSQFNDPVELSAEFTAPTAERPAVLMITANIAPGWHVYSLTQPPGGPTKTRIELTPSSEYQLAGQFHSQPQPTERVDDEAWVGLTIEEHSGRVTWYAPVALASGVDPATLVIAGQVRMLACKDSCIPITKDFTARLGPGVAVGDLDLAAAAPAAVGTVTSSPASFQPEGSEVKISGRIVADEARPGGSALLKITLTPAPNWHIYGYADQDNQPGSKPTLIAFEQLSGLKAGRPTTAAAMTTDNSIPEFGSMRYHTGPVTWEVPIDVPPSTKPGEYPIKGVIAYQACETRDDGLGSCELPKAVKFAATLTVGNVPGSVAPLLTFAPTTYKEAAAVAANWAAEWSGSVPLTAASSQSTAPNTQAQEYDLSRIDVKETAGSLAYYIVLAFVGGIILNLMPCVLPVIGLKVMSFVQQSGHSRAHALVLNLWYSAGIVAVFLLLGFLAAWIGLSWGGQFGSTAFTVTLAAIVFAMSLSLLGVWEIPIPGFFGSGAVQDVAAREGPLGAFLKGAITTVLATPCTGPFMASAIAWAVTQSMSTTLIVFGSLGLGMASPYLVIGVFPELLRFLPKPGAWMETFKQITGFILLATVVFLLSFMDPTAVVPTVALLLGVGLACWLVSRTPLTAGLADRLQSWSLAGAVVLLAAVISFGWIYAKDARVDWQPFSLARLQQVAVDQGRTVLVDFSADWCITCKALEKTVLHTQRVQQAIADSGAVPMYGDYTDYPPEIERTIRALKSNGVPVIAIFPGERPYEPIVFRDGYTAHGLIAALKQAGGSKTARPSQAVAAAETALN